MIAAREVGHYELCIDFANTVDWRNGKNGKVPKDSLTSYADLAKWCREKGLIRTKDLASAGASGEMALGADTLKRAVELRETIYRLFSAVAHGKEPHPRDVETLNEFLASRAVGPRLARGSEGFRWEWNEGRAAADRMLWPIAKSAADLLTSDRVKDVGECANEEEGCGWLFLDCTKNHTRRWCSASGCGNRDKVRRFYQKHKEA